MNRVERVLLRLLEAPRPSNVALVGNSRLQVQYVFEEEIKVIGLSSLSQLDCLANPRAHFLISSYPSADRTRAFYSLQQAPELTPSSAQNYSNIEDLWSPRSLTRRTRSPSRG